MNVLTSVLEVFSNIIATLASAANPAYAPLIQVAAQGLNAELVNIGNGGKPTLHSVAGDVVAPAVAIAAQKAISNSGNAKTQAAVTAGATALISALQNVPPATPSPAEEAPASPSSSASPDASPTSSAVPTPPPATGAHVGTV